MKPLRETANYVATIAPKGRVRITAKDRKATPRSRVISASLWRQLEPMSDSEFDGSIVLELGIGTFARRTP